MKLKLLALSGLMAATMGQHCDSNKENAVEDINDAQEELQDAEVQLEEAAAKAKKLLLSKKVGRSEMLLTLKLLLLKATLKLLRS